jgi:hypothetical protein
MYTIRYEYVHVNKSLFYFSDDINKTYQFVHIVVWTMFIVNEWLIITENIKTKARRRRVIIVQNTCEQLGSFACNIKGKQVLRLLVHPQICLFIICLKFI